MKIVSLIAAPGRLSPDLVGSLRNAWGGGDAQWLSPDEAAEFPVASVPGNFDEVRGDVAGLGVDLNVLPFEGRRKRILLADMDSTLIEQECIDELAVVAGVGDQVAEITARAMNGEIGFEGALTERVGLLEGLSDGVIGQVLEERITYRAGGRTAARTMRAHAGALSFLVSGGFTAFAEKVAASLEFDRFRANELLVDSGVLTGTVAYPILGRDAKVATLEELVAEFGLSAEDVLAVGDGANDLGMLGRAGMGVAMHAKPSVAAASQYRINHGNLTALLYLQGYSRDEFV